MLTIPPKLKQRRECRKRQKDILNGLLNNYDKTTVSGDNITINDCIQAPTNIIIRGKEISQATETGNLIDNDWEQGAIDYNTGNLVVDNTRIRTKNFIKVYPNHLYKISRTITTNSMGFRFYDKNYNFLGNQDTSGILKANNSLNYMSNGVSSMEFTIINNNVSFIKIQEGSQDLSIIYTMRTEAINIDYPSSLEYVEGNQKIEHVNKNLISLGTFINGYTQITNGIFAENQTCKSIYIETSKLPKLITINAQNANRSNVSYYDEVPKTNIKSKEYPTANSTVLPRSIEINKKYKYIVIQFTYQQEASNYQIEEEDTSTEYTPHQSETYQLTNLPPMYSENDKIVYLKTDDKNSVDGEGWYVYNTYTKMILNGLENWFLERINDFGIANFGLSNIPNYNRNNNTDGILTSFKKQTTVIAETKDSGFILNNEARLYIRVDTNVNPILTVDEFKLWLSENNQELVYKLLNPIYTKITDPILIKQLNELQKKFTYEGTNHFIVTAENGQACNLDVTVYKNSIKIMQKEIDNLKELVLNNVANS